MLKIMEIRIKNVNIKKIFGYINYIYVYIK